MNRSAVVLVLVFASTSCFFDFGRGAGLEPGDVSGRAVRDAPEVAPYAEVVPSGVGRVTRTDADGSFVIRGLSPGGYSARLRDDRDGDGWPERVAERSFAINVQEHATGLFGAGGSRATWVLLGDIELRPVVQVSGAVTLNGQPRPGAKVFVWAKRQLPSASLGDGVEQTALLVDAEAESYAGTDANGRFRFDALAAGELTFTAFWLDEDTGEEHSSEPFTLDAPEGDTVEVADLQLQMVAVQAPPPAAALERDVQLELSPAPEGTLSVRLERADIPADQRNEHHVYEADFPASRSIVIRPPVGAWRVFLADSEQRRVFTSVHVAPPGDDPVLWRLHLSETDPCDDDDDGVRDCDDDGLPGLPEIESWSDADVASTWAPCASTCGGLFGDELLEASCSVGGDTYDCDDDGDGQPDVTEHYDCYGLFLGRDLDGDGLCEPEDPFPECAANDPTHPSCAFDSDAPFVRPPPRDELDGLVGVDAGPDTDAGDPDAGPDDAGVFDGGVPFDAGPLEDVTVEPLYPNNGADWNSHVRNDGATVFTASDTACDGTETGRYEDVCVHGGERKVASLPSRTSCAGLSAADNLGLFGWRCDDAGAQVRFLSEGLLPGRGLVDAMDFSAGAFVPMRVLVSESGAVVAASELESWWPNDVVIDNDGMLLDEAVDDTVYVVNTSMPSEAYFLNGTRVTLLIDPLSPVSGLLAFTGDQLFPFDATGSVFLWLEGMFEGEYGDPWLGANPATFPRVRRFDCVECASLVSFEDAQGGLVDDARVACSASGGFSHELSWSQTIPTHWVFRELRLTECNLSLEMDRGLVHDVDVDDAWSGWWAFTSNTAYVDVHAANTAGSGLEIGHGGGQIVAGASFVGTSGSGLDVQLSLPSQGCLTGTALTTFGHQNHGVWLNGAKGCVLEDVLSSFSRAGLRMDGAERCTIENLVAAQNAESSVQVFAGVDNKLTGVFKTGGDYNVLGVCEDDSLNSPVGPGDMIVHMTCTDDGTAGSSTYTGHLSDAVYTPGLDMDQVIVGRAPSDEVNPSDDAGVIYWPDEQPPETQGAYEHALRGIDARAEDVFGDFTTEHFCSGTFNCQIWDVALRGTDTKARNINPLPTGDDTRVHRWWLEPAAGVASDCDAFPGSAFNMIDAVCETVHLKHAWERVGDRIGNDNGLCESDEHCMWSRNIGAYQGHGELVSAGTFTDGTITGVTLWTWSENGY